jgi:hypothetical protein
MATPLENSRELLKMDAFLISCIRHRSLYATRTLSLLIER